MILDVKKGLLHGDLGKRVWGRETAGAKGLSGNMLRVPKGSKRGLCGRRQVKWGQQVERKDGELGHADIREPG